MSLKALDLFCGAGGASMGLHRAGFDVTGVDLVPQPQYPFRFVQADALAVDLAGYDLLWASPPCQAYTTMANRFRGTGGSVDAHPDLLAPIRARLHAAGTPYVIENVRGARRRMHRDRTVVLSGEMFGLGVYRPRLFECSWALLTPQVPRPRRDALPIYGPLDGRRIWTRVDGTELRAPRSLADAGAAMGIDWMAWRELTQAIPPAYSEFLARTFLRQREAA